MWNSLYGNVKLRADWILKYALKIFKPDFNMQTHFSIWHTMYI